ncbi:Uncharacterised protein [Bordetella pertussis]|nr:Uncharacterised protein [Bordetella pertussis]
MPAVWNAPLASVAPTSRTLCTWSASAWTSCRPTSSSCLILSTPEADTIRCDSTSDTPRSACSRRTA